MSGKLITPQQFQRPATRNLSAELDHLRGWVIGLLDALFEKGVLVQLDLDRRNFGIQLIPKPPAGAAAPDPVASATPEPGPASPIDAPAPTLPGSVPEGG